MSFHVVTGTTEFDTVLSPETWREHRTFADFFDGMDFLRNDMEEAKQIIRGRERAGVSPGGYFMRVACFPRRIWRYMLALEPHILKDRKLFYKLLRRYPMYKAGHVKIIGGQGWQSSPSPQIATTLLKSKQHGPQVLSTVKDTSALPNEKLEA